MNAELSGYLELGMNEEAEQLASAYLRNRGISSYRFSEAMDAILVSSDVSRWRPNVEQAFANLSPEDQQAMRFTMLSFYWSLHDLGAAHRFLVCDNKCEACELLMGMDIYLHLGKMVDAAAVARRCERLLKKASSDFDEGNIRAALADYYSKIGDPVRALDCWTAMPLNSPFLRNALINTVELSLLPALTALQRAFDAVVQKKRDPDLSIEIQKPGLEDQLTADIERDLKKLKRKINAIVSPIRQRELGIAGPNRTESKAFDLVTRHNKNKNCG